MKTPTRVFATAAVVAGALLIAAWGDAGHRITGEAAALSMHGSTPAFFRNASKQLAYLNPEPDRWKDRAERDADRALDGAFNADHFIDTEMVPPEVLAAALAAPNRYAYADTLRKAGIDAAVFGFLPFAILEYSQKLRVDFRNWRAAPDSVKPFTKPGISTTRGCSVTSSPTDPIRSTRPINTTVG